jgi:hypothetical protein
MNAGSGGQGSGTALTNRRSERDPTPSGQIGLLPVTPAQKIRPGTLCRLTLAQ